MGTKRMKDRGQLRFRKLSPQTQWLRHSAFRGAQFLPEGQDQSLVQTRRLSSLNTLALERTVCRNSSQLELWVSRQFLVLHLQIGRQRPAQGFDQYDMQLLEGYLCSASYELCELSVVPCYS